MKENKEYNIYKSKKKINSFYNAYVNNLYLYVSVNLPKNQNKLLNSFKKDGERLKFSYELYENMKLIRSKYKSKHKINFSVNGINIVSIIHKFSGYKNFLEYLCAGFFTITLYKAIKVR